ncbi:MAG TPA: hydroxysqualene dehydroxylase HpnE [Thiobacillus sp.]
MTAGTSPHVAIIGGGWAGCSAALTLAEAGIRVSLFEASRTLGGRARAVEIEGQSLDNGQHILLGAYEQTLKLIHRLHRGKTDTGLWRLPLTLRQPPDFSLACPRLPAPLHLMAGLLGSHGLTWREKISAARWAHATLHNTHPVDPLTVSQLTASQPEKLNRLLWHPLCISALNTPPALASAQVFRAVLQSAFGGCTHDSDLLFPRLDLTSLLPGPAAVRIVELGGHVHLSTRVNALHATDDAITLSTPEQTVACSHVILATAPQHVSALATNVAALNEVAHAVSTYQYQPIATGYIQYDHAFQLAEPFFALANGPAQFVFDRGQSHGQAGLMAFVASTASELNENWLDQAEAQLTHITQPGPVLWRKRIIEKQATFNCVPNMHRPSVQTTHPRIYLAGDYTASPYPATLESATVSGVQSASVLLKAL